jgi:hypothetical protein
LLQSTAWAGWIEDAPTTEIADNADSFHSAAMKWLGDAPGHNAALTAEEIDALSQWVTKYQLKLLGQMIDEPGLGEDRLIMAFWSTIGGAVGVSAVAKLGIAVTLAGPIVASGLGILAAGFASASILKNSKKARRQRMIREVETSLTALIDKLHR